ncbi:MAG: 50S ribosomal protein L2 [Minisyncoccia bacterium]
MPIFKKPVTPGQRKMTKLDFSMLTKKEPEKSLLVSIKEKAGRDNKGRISVRHKGGRVKRMYRIIDFGENHIGLKGKVIALEYDPNRTAFIALVEYENKEKAYILAPHNLKVGDEILCQQEAPIKIGNRLKLKNIPTGVQVYNIELMPLKGGKIVRSAGTSATCMGQDGKYTILKMPSGEIRKINNECFASIGVVSNPENRFRKIGKAGISRKKGKRPAVRGSAMNPVDHPHGGGEGRTGIGLKHPKTPWGKPAFISKTRKKKWTDKLILKSRKENKK